MYVPACGDPAHGSCGCGWTKGRLLGRGAHGSVYLARMKESGADVAVKQVTLDGLGDHDLARAIEHEVGLISSLSHPNIVRYLGTHACGDCLNILLEYCPNGSLRQLLQQKGALPEAVVALYTREILEGLSYLHDNGIAHRDIKGANVLVAYDGALKLADFGASKRLGHESVMSGLKGTPHWMAPEIIKGQQGSSQGWKKADVWSLGCTVVEMLTGKIPWPMYTNPISAMYHIASGKVPPLGDLEVSDAAKEFINRCCQLSPDDRPLVDDLLSDSFLDLAPPQRTTSSSMPHCVVMSAFPISPAASTSTTMDPMTGSVSTGSKPSPLPSPLSASLESTSFAFEDTVETPTLPTEIPNLRRSQSVPAHALQPQRPRQQQPQGSYTRPSACYGLRGAQPQPPESPSEITKCRVQKLRRGASVGSQGIGPHLLNRSHGSGYAGMAWVSMSQQQQQQQASRGSANPFAGHYYGSEYCAGQGGLAAGVIDECAFPFPGDLELSGSTQVLEASSPMGGLDDRTGPLAVSFSGSSSHHHRQHHHSNTHAASSPARVASPCPSAYAASSADVSRGEDDPLMQSGASILSVGSSGPRPPATLERASSTCCAEVRRQALHHLQRQQATGSFTTSTYSYHASSPHANVSLDVSCSSGDFSLSQATTASDQLLFSPPSLGRSRSLSVDSSVRSLSLLPSRLPPLSRMQSEGLGPPPLLPPRGQTSLSSSLSSTSSASSPLPWPQSIMDGEDDDVLTGLVDMDCHAVGAARPHAHGHHRFMSLQSNPTNHNAPMASSPCGSVSTGLAAGHASSKKKRHGYGYHLKPLPANAGLWEQAAMRRCSEKRKEETG